MELNLFLWQAVAVRAPVILIVSPDLPVLLIQALALALRARALRPILVALQILAQEHLAMMAAIGFRVPRIVPHLLAYVASSVVLIVVVRTLVAHLLVPPFPVVTGFARAMAITSVPQG